MNINKLKIGEEVNLNGVVFIVDGGDINHEVFGKINENELEKLNFYCFKRKKKSNIHPNYIYLNQQLFDLALKS